MCVCVRARACVFEAMVFVRVVGEWERMKRVGVRREALAIEARLCVRSHECTCVCACACVNVCVCACACRKEKEGEV